MTTSLSPSATIARPKGSTSPRLRKSNKLIDGSRAIFVRNDARICATIYCKYGRLQRERVGWILHNASSSIVKEAEERRLAIVMEDLKGIRELHRRGTGQGNDYRARLNSWSYYELQRQIEYKARWKGIQVIYVAASGTSEVLKMWVEGIPE